MVDVQKPEPVAVEQARKMLEKHGVDRHRINGTFDGTRCYLAPNQVLPAMIEFAERARLTTDRSLGADLTDRFWLIVREPGMVPDRKGSFKHPELAKRLREFMAANPTSFIDVLTIGHDGVPDVQHGPEALQMADGRSMSVGRKHNARVRAAALAATPPVPADDRHPGWTEAGHRWLDAGCPSVPAISEEGEKLREAVKRLRFNADFQRGYGNSEFFMRRDDADLILATLATPDAAINLPADVHALVIAGREFWEANDDTSDEARAMLTALEAFSERVPYENEPDAAPIGSDDAGAGA